MDILILGQWESSRPNLAILVDPRNVVMLCMCWFEELTRETGFVSLPHATGYVLHAYVSLAISCMINLFIDTSDQQDLTSSI